jgi:hypothetical protein
MKTAISQLGTILAAPLNKLSNPLTLQHNHLEVSEEKESSSREVRDNGPYLKRGLEIPLFHSSHLKMIEVF